MLGSHQKLVRVEGTLEEVWAMRRKGSSHSFGPIEVVLIDDLLQLRRRKPVVPESDSLPGCRLLLATRGTAAHNVHLGTKVLVHHTVVLQLRKLTVRGVAQPVHLHNHEVSAAAAVHICHICCPSL